MNSKRENLTLSNFKLKQNFSLIKTHSIIKFALIILVAAIMFSSANNPFVFAQTTPAYAFNGAYFTYQISGTSGSSTVSGTVTYTISNVNPTTQTYTVTISYSSGQLSTIFGTGGSSTYNFDDSSGFALSPSVLQTMLNTGTYYYYGVTKGVSVTVPAGTFTAVQLQYSGIGIWFDQNTGILLKETGSYYSSLSSVNMELQSTNISGTTAFPTLLVVIIVIVVVVVVCIVAFLMVRRRKARQKLTAGNVNQPITTPPPPPPPSTTSI